MSNAISVTPITDFSALKKMAEEGDLWVINNTDQISENRARGIMTFGVKDTNGDVTPVVLTDTWIPINIATRCDPVHCVNSQHFRESVGKRVIVVISPEEAKTIMASDAAIKELRNVEEFRRGHSQATKVPAVQDNKMSISTNKSAVLIPDNEQENMAVVESGNSDDRRLMELVKKANEGALDDDTAVEQLLQLQPTQEGLKAASGEVRNFGSNLAEEISKLIS